MTPLSDELIWLADCMTPLSDALIWLADAEVTADWLDKADDRPDTEDVRVETEELRTETADEVTTDWLDNDAEILEIDELIVDERLAICELVDKESEVIWDDSDETWLEIDDDSPTVICA